MNLYAGNATLLFSCKISLFTNMLQTKLYSAVYLRSNNRILIKNRECQAKEVGFTYFGIYRHDSVKLHFYDVNLLFHHTPKGLC